MLATAAAMSLLAGLSQPNWALAAPQYAPSNQPDPQQQRQQQQQQPGPQNQAAPPVKSQSSSYQLPQGNQVSRTYAYMKLCSAGVLLAAQQKSSDTAA